MTAELAPAVIAAVGGGALLGVVVVTEARREAQMRRERVPSDVTFPLALGEQPAHRALAALSGLDRDVELVAEVAASGESIRHRLYLPASVAASVGSQLRAAVPGLRLTSRDPEPSRPTMLRLAITVPARALLRSTDPEGAGRALLAALLPLGSYEEVVLRWALRPGRPGSDPEATATPSPTERQRARAWQTKLGEAGFFASGVVLVRAGDVERARALAARVVAVLSTRRGPHSGLLIRRRRGGEFPKAGRRSGWLSVVELLTLFGWPLGEDVPVGVEVGAARQIAPAQALGRRGRPLFVAERHGQARPVALDAEAARHHMAVLGPTGSGKSVVLAAAVLSDLERGYGGVLLDPKGDTVQAVLERVPAAHADRVVVIDPTDPGPIPGVDLLGHGDPDLRADVLLSVLRALSRDAWGPRIDSYLRLGLRTLAEVPGASLTDWPALFLDPNARRAAVGRLRDPLLIGQWQAFEALSEPERAQHIAAPMSRVLSLIGRPAVRAVVAQPNPRLDVGRLLDERRWLLVSLSSGVLGAPAARLIGATVTYVIWSAVAARGALPEEQRRPVFLAFDETQALVDLGFGLEELLEQARGLGAGVTIATQATARLSEPVRTALFSNVATLMSFRAGSDEAKRIARELPGLNATDLQSLQPFEVAARVGTGKGAGSVVVTGRTEPLPPTTGQAQRVRQLSAERYGRSREEIEAAIQDRYGTRAEPVDTEAIGRGRRQS